MDGAIDIDACFEQSAKKVEELVVHHFLTNTPQDRFVGDFVKASLNVTLDDPGEAVVRQLAASSHRVVCAPVGPKPVGVLVKLDFKDRFQRHRIASWTILSRRQGIPSWRILPLALGISTRRSGRG